MIEQLPTPAGTPLPTPAGTPLPHPTETIVKAKKVSKIQSKPLLFINHDAKHLKPQATRSEITSHLRSAYQPWKHRMQARARREASKSVITARSLKYPATSDEEAFAERDTFREPTHDSESQELVLVHGTEDVDEGTISRTPSPLFYQGNSDPFSALSFKITPLIAELIKFEHAHLHPCIYSTKNTPSRAYGTSYLADMHGPAANQAAVYGYLSRAAIVLSSASPDPRFAQAALVLKGKSSALLRAQLASGDAANQGDLSRKILALMIAELFAHNYDAALIHSKILMGLLKQLSETEEFDMRFFFSVVYSEIQRSCMSLTRPCFNVSPNGWVARMFESVGGNAFRALSSTLNIDETPLEPSVLGIELAEIFGEVRRVRLVSQEYSNSPVYGTPTPLALYLPARVVLCLGKLVRFYVDHCQGRLVPNMLPRDLIHRAAVLGALYWVRKAGHIDSIKVSSTSTIYSAGPMILARLREALTRFDEIASPEENLLYKDLRFWVLYIGAQQEQGKARLHEIVETWFTARLAKASADINVYTWQQARPILERYPHPDAAEPHGSTWFSSIFSDISTSSTCLGGVFARAGPDAKLASTLYGAGDDYMNWSTDKPIASEVSSRIDKDLSCAALAQSTWPESPISTTFSCPTWDIGQEGCWMSEAESTIPQIQREEGNFLLRNDPKLIENAARSVAFATSPGKRTNQYFLKQQTARNPAAVSSHLENQYDPTSPTSWLSEQEQKQTYASSTSTSSPAALAYRSSDTNAPKSHLFNPSAQCWQTACSGNEAQTEYVSTEKGYRYTSRMNDPELTGIENEPVAFALYPEMEMDEAEAQARRYDFL